MSRIKIKVFPEDFIVEEMTSLPWNDKGSYGVFILTKKGWNTLDAIQKLSRRFHLSVNDFAYGGRKDRHAHTTQTITIRDAFSLSHREEDLSLEFKGRMDRPMGPDLILANRFEVTVRDLTLEETETALEKVKLLEVTGFPNYFDDQRFGSYDPNQGFLAEKIIKGHFNGALKIYMTRMEGEECRDTRSWFYHQWGNWEECLKKALTDFETEAFSFLCRHPKGYLPLLQKIPGEEMAFYFSAFQSFFWNEIVRRIIRPHGSREYYPGCCGDYYFPMQAEEKMQNYLSNLNIPLLSSKVVMPDAMTQALYETLLKEREIRTAQFNVRKIRQAFFKSIDRSAVVFPQALSVVQVNDESYQNKKKLRFCFTLPRGSYATMLLKRVFSENLNC
jgi:tRNA pseudouridine13 synthase